LSLSPLEAARKAGQPDLRPSARPLDPAPSATQVLPYLPQCSNSA